MSGESTIKDGRGGETARVGKNNRLFTDTISKDAVIDSSLNGNTFFMTTGSVNLTSDSESWLLFLKNNDTFQWVVESLEAAFGATDGVGDSFVQFNVGATEGTLISEGVDLPAINLNIGSPKQLPSTVKLGGEGKTLTNGVNTPKTLIPEGSKVRTFTAGPVIIPPGVSFSIAYTPPSGNTNQNVSAQIVIFREIVQ